MDEREPRWRRPDDRKSLRHVRAAQLRAKAVRWAIGKSVLGSVFLVGALSYALGPAPHERASVMWMAALVVMSTFNVGLGLRTFGRVNRKVFRYWLPATVAWGVLSAALLKMLLRR
jgi:uncharacterized membrane protein YfcA